jgi:hypothetical protein
MTTVVVSMAKTTEPSRQQHAVNVAAVSVAIFLVLMAFLIWRLEAGNDPALGASTTQPAAQKVIKRKLVVHRKIVKVIRDLPPVEVAPPSSSGSGYSSSASGSGGTSTYSAPAPSYSAPAPAPVQSAPAPAPAPATSAS